MPLTLSSPAFDANGVIPVRHTRDGDNLSPHLTWSGVPAGTQSFVLIIEDPDAPNGVFRHWGAFDIPGGQTELREGSGSKASGDVRFARNDFGQSRYDGPEPPRGHGTHHYIFRLAALDVRDLGVPDDTPVEDVWHAARRHMLEETELVGTYER